MNINIEIEPIIDAAATLAETLGSMPPFHATLLMGGGLVALALVLDFFRRHR